MNYDAPATDNCFFRVSTTPATDTLNTNHISDGQTNAGARVLNLSGLSAGINYLDLICGQRVGTWEGTWRESAQFQIGTLPSKIKFTGRTVPSGRTVIP